MKKITYDQRSFYIAELVAFAKIPALAVLLGVLAPLMAQAAVTKPSETAPWALFCDHAGNLQASCAIAQTVVARQKPYIKFKMGVARNGSGLLTALMKFEPPPKAGADPSLFIDGVN